MEGDLFASHPRLVESLRAYRQQVRPGIGHMHARGDRSIPFGSDKEHALLGAFVKQRGLKVQHSPYTYYDEGSHTLYHPAPEDHQATGKAFLRMLGPVKFARRKRPATQEELSFLAHQIAQRSEWRKGLRATPPVDNPMHDENARLIFADWLGDRGDPREMLVRGAVPFGGRASGGLAFHVHPEGGTTPHQAHLLLGDNLPGGPMRKSELGGTWDFGHDMIHPTVSEARTPEGFIQRPAITWRNHTLEGNPGYRYHPPVFFTPVTWEEYHKYADTLDPEKRKQWYSFAKHSYTDGVRGTKKAKLARFAGPGATVRAAGSDNTAARLGLAKRVLAEAGLQGARTRAVFAHGGATGLRPAVAIALTQTENPAITRFAAAWLGLLLQQRSMTTFHPGAGEDTLHIIDTPHPHEQVADYMKRAGVPSYTLEPKGGGTRAFIVAPMDLNDATRIANGLQGTHSAIQGTATRLGAGGSDKDARAAFRQVIDDSEKQAGLQ